jgi:tetratricopeptide (TPR) repeat protein
LTPMASSKTRKRRKDKNDGRPRRRRLESLGRTKQIKKLFLDASPIFAEALERYRRNQFEDVLQILNAEIDFDGLESAQDRLTFLRLQVMSLPHLERYVEAEKYALKGLEIDDNDIDFLFALAYINLILKEYDNVIAYANRYIRSFESVASSGKGGLYLSNNSRHLLYNYLGIAYRQKNKTAEAQKAFEESILSAVWYDHAYVNLANLFHRARRYAEAEAVIERGLKYCSQAQELRILKNSLANRATISACMIVKNEEEHLPACLASIRNWVDEIIVVDTGSSDRTVEIAESYGARVFFQKWEGDFSKARNYSLAQATKDWIFIIDADEEFVEEDVPLIRQVVGQNKYRLVSINVYNMNKETGEYTSFLPSFRLYRRDAGFYYDGIVHNQLKFDRSEPVLRVGIRLRHYGYSLSPEKMKKKLARSRELLEKQLRDTPNEPYVHFNYAQLLRGNGVDLDDETCRAIIYHAGKAIELTKDKLGPYLHVHLMAHHQLITTYMYQKRLQEAEELCLKALELKPDYLDPVLSLGHIYSQMRKFDKAEEYFKKYLDMQAVYDESMETANLILLYIRARHIANYGLGIIEHIRGNIDKAEAYFRAALTEQDPYLDAHLRLARIYLDRGELEKASPHIEKDLANNPRSELGNLYKAEYFIKNNMPDEAEKYISLSLANAKDNPEVYERIGCYYANRGWYDRAIPFFERLAEIKPEYDYSLKLTAKAYYDSGDFEKSLAFYRKYLGLKPKDTEAIINAANCLYKRGLFSEAEELYTRALSESQNLALIYRNLGLTKLNLGKAKEALLLLEKYLEIAPEDLEIQMALGITYMNLNLFGEAIPHFEKYLAGHPYEVEGLFRISECYYHLGYVDSALIGYRQILKINPSHKPAGDRILELKPASISV